MNEDVNPGRKDDCSSIRFDILIDEAWVDNILNEFKIDIPVNEKIVLTNLRIAFGEGILYFIADLLEKESTSIEITSSPVWDAEHQYLNITELKLKTDTKNVLIKSAGIFAQIFLNEKIDRKLEEQANLLYAKQLQKLKDKPVEIPLPKGGKALAMISSITIHTLDFLDQAVRVNATIDANLNAHLFNAKS